MFLIRFKIEIETGQSKTLSFGAESHYFVLCALWIKVLSAEISTQDPLLCHRIKVDVTVAHFDTLLNCVSHTKMPGRGL